MNHFFEDKKARELFNKYLSTFDWEDGKSHFRVAIKEAWDEKQFSDQDLESYKLNSEDVRAIYDTIADHHSTHKN